MHFYDDGITLKIANIIVYSSSVKMPVVVAREWGVIVIKFIYPSLFSLIFLFHFSLHRSPSPVDTSDYSCCVVINVFFNWLNKCNFGTKRNQAYETHSSAFLPQSALRWTPRLEWNKNKLQLHFPLVIRKICTSLYLCDNLKFWSLIQHRQSLSPYSER